jgi:uncharacterized protein
VEGASRKPYDGTGKNCPSARCTQPFSRPPSKHEAQSEEDIDGCRQNARTGSHGRPSRQGLLRIYEQTKTIAVVGASANGHKAARTIPTYLQSQRYRIIPVNPKGGEILGERVYPSLDKIDVPVDVVDVFRPPTEAEAIARQAIAIGADVLWFQPGTHTKEAIQLAAGADLTVVAGRCMGATHRELGLGPRPSWTVGPSEPAIVQ